MRVGRFIREGLTAIVGDRDQRVAGLDFLRTVAVFFVVCGHFTVGPDGGEVSRLRDRIPLFHLGWTGVDLFFVLSGYLIGRQLWKEKVATGTVRFARFVARRGLRIWPYYFAFAAVLTAFTVPGEGTPYLADLFFYSNYAKHGISGGWSLSTEEQFYIIGPLLVAVLGRWLPARGFFWVLAAALAAVLLGRHASVATDETLYYQLHTHNDGLIIGLTIALIFTLRPRWLTRDDLTVRGWLAGAAMAGAGVILRLLERRTFNFLSLALIFGGIAVGLLLDRSAISRLLRGRLFHALSVLSYGMYLNHFIIVAVLVPRWPGLASGFPPLLSLAAGVTTLFALSALLAACSYVAIEHPFLVLRDRWLGHRPA